MRAREFLMKDAYSFHLDEACLQRGYDADAWVGSSNGRRDEPV